MNKKAGGRNDYNWICEVYFTETLLKEKQIAIFNAGGLDRREIKWKDKLERLYQIWEKYHGMARIPVMEMIDELVKVTCRNAPSIQLIEEEANGFIEFEESEVIEDGDIDDLMRELGIL